MSQAQKIHRHARRSTAKLGVRHVRGEMLRSPDAHSCDAVSEYVPIDKEALDWGVCCRDSGFTRVGPGSPYPLDCRMHPSDYARSVTTGRVLNEYQLVYITHGRGWFSCAQRAEEAIEGGTVFLLFPGVEHRYHPDEATGWTEYWVGFSGSQVDRLLDSGVFSAERPVHRIGIDQNVIVAFEQILQLCRLRTRGFQLLLGPIVLQQLARLRLAHAGGEELDRKGEIVRRARSIMNESVYSECDMGELARACGVSYSLLLKSFKEHTGMTPKECFLQKKMHTAKRLLLNDTVSVKEVSSRLSFDNPFYFSRLFKKKTGVTPTAWRASKARPAGKKAR